MLVLYKGPFLITPPSAAAFLKSLRDLGTPVKFALSSFFSKWSPAEHSLSQDCKRRPIKGMQLDFVWKHNRQCTRQESSDLNLGKQYLMSSNQCPANFFYFPASWRRSCRSVQAPDFPTHSKPFLFLPHKNLHSVRWNPPLSDQRFATTFLWIYCSPCEKKQTQTK